MKNKLLVCLIAFFVGVGPIFVQGQAFVQFVHNSPDLSLDSMDVYINKSLVLDNFKFRQASEFIQGPTGFPLVIDICPGNATGPDNPVYTTAIVLGNGKKYLAIASGTIDGNGYNPWQPFSLEIVDYARSQSANSTKSDIIFYHGSTDLPTIRIFDKGNGSVLSEHLAYAQFDGYKEMNPATYTLEIQDSATQAKLFTVSLDLTAMQGKAGVVMASGFANPGNNNGGQSLGIFYVPSEGGMAVQLPLVPDPLASIQFIHNSADLSITQLDVWVGDKKFASNLHFRSATSFTEFPADVSTTIAIKPAGSTSPENPLASLTYTFADQQNYILIINGISSTSGYNPTPPLTLVKKDNCRQNALTAGQTDVLIFHGSTDAPTINIYETGQGIGLLADNLSYGNFHAADYSNLATADYVIDVKTQDGATTLYSYNFPLAALGLQNEAITLLASGFVNPASNSNGPAFGLFIARSIGGDLIALPTYTPPQTCWIQVIHNSADPAASPVDFWVGEQKVFPGITYQRASGFVEVPAGNNIPLFLVAAGASGTTNPLATVTVNLEAGKRHSVIIDGIASTSGFDPLQPLTLHFIPNIRLVATNSSKVDVLFHHGITDGPQVGIYEFTSGLIYEPLSYGSSSPYVEVDGQNQGWHILSGGNVLKSYEVIFSGTSYIGKTVFAIASGFINPSNNSNGQPFGLFLVPTDGGGFSELKEVTGVVENDALSLSVRPNPASDYVYIDLQNVMNYEVKVSLIAPDGKLLHSEQFRNQSTVTLDVHNLPKGIYFLKIKSGNLSAVRKLGILR
ncbi:MAG: DUF4397 domain-containing protein [Bacteroidales bacterium]|nr:DUF4397 domain-containing protein [Bacteroidales bacterium]NPV35263.1 DUF4397 domain-containing protein [Bacteroidales bacterium]